MRRLHLTDRQWAVIESFLPPPARTRRPRADDQQTVEGIVHILITGCRWQDLPREYGAPAIVWRRLKRWSEEGVWKRIWRVAFAALDQQGRLDWAMAFSTACFYLNAHEFSGCPPYIADNPTVKEPRRLLSLYYVSTLDVA
jgi:transposase